MSDQCKNCQVRGDYELCINTECFHHENWINIQRIERLKKTEWISVDDKLPRRLKDVLFFDSDNNIICLGWLNKNNTFTEHRRFVHNVSHWMELPEVPK